MTGGSGTLGSYLVPRLLGRNHEVRVLSRRPAALPHLAEADVLAGDVVSGDGLDQALDGVDVVVHAATRAVRPGSHRTEVQGTNNVVEIGAKHGVHCIYVSIVGVDRHRFPYYRAKWEAEQLVEARAGSWAIQRATQFHDLLAQALHSRVMPATKNMSFQLVDPSEVSDHLVGLVESRQEGRAPDFGGPEVLPVRDIAKIWRAETGRRAVVMRVPRLGFLADFDAGAHLCPDQRAGRITFAEWLRHRESPTDPPDIAA